MTFLELWWVFPAAIAFSTVAIGSGVSGALFFSPFFMLVVGLSPVKAIGAGLMTEVFGMGNGLRSYVKAKIVDYATARWLLAGAIPGIIVGSIVADVLTLDGSGGVHFDENLLGTASSGGGNLEVLSWRPIGDETN